MQAPLWFWVCYRRLVRHFKRLWSENTAWMEWLLGHVAMACGVLVLLPGAVDSPPFVMLGRVIPEIIWGAMLLVEGFWQSWFASRPLPTHRAVSAVVGALTWFFLANATLISAMNSTAISLALAIYPILTLGWLLVLLKQPLEFYDDASRWLHIYAVRMMRYSQSFGNHAKPKSKT